MHVVQCKSNIQSKYILTSCYHNMQAHMGLHSVSLLMLVSLSSLLKINALPQTPVLGEAVGLELNPAVSTNLSQSESVKIRVAHGLDFSFH